MTTITGENISFVDWLKDKLFLGMPFGEYLKKQITPFNIIAALILCVGIPIAFVRFTQGLAATTNLTNNNPWGMWIGVDVLCGVALAAGGFTLGSAVYLFGMKEYHPIVRPAVLTGFLGYFFVVIGLCFDLGRPWRLPYPILVSYGTTSVMFLVGWHVLLYLSCQFVEFCPALFEWLGWRKFRKIAVSVTVGATIFGSSLSHRVFSHQISMDHKKFDKLTIGLGKAAAMTLFAYFCLKLIGVAHGDHWHLLGTPMGQWFLLEVLGFVLAPCFLLVWAVRQERAGWVRFAAIWTVLGIILNRVNVSMIAFNWNLPDRYVPKWTEFAVTITIITAGVLTFRWIVNRMPILWEHPDYEPEI